jgi:hypothetical protein
MPFQFADAAFIVRAAQKDEYYQRTLCTQLVEVVTLLLGTRFVSTHEAKLTSLGELAYALAVLQGRQSLGEEFCELLSVTPTKATPHRARILWPASFGTSCCTFPCHRCSEPL